MLGVVQTLAAAAGVVHLYIFVLESVLFTRPAVYSKVFRVSEADLAAVRPWAFNQGFYNLFRAIAVLSGTVLLRVREEAGWALILMGCGLMAAAAIVLVARDRGYARAATMQGTFPAPALLAGLANL
ncbi:DUF1304 domain-containing protein [Nocardia panacis]|uniref:DUF1304 domain-containing protein n=1 Tax=Nocardia panacis TaxID=2340916 RepID=A0A3A4K7D5_9NOCA|nr:DUF1304 domain-containing protein [Nocardia panacis]RJO70627.1 DUF1304 domain-containing protein [Nocardia panacis]